MLTDKEIGSRIADVRKQRKKTQSDFARILKLSRGAIANKELAYRSKFLAKEIATAAKWLRVDPSIFLTIETYDTHKPQCNGRINRKKREVIFMDLDEREARLIKLLRKLDEHALLDIYDHALELILDEG
jgi:transcriptional regulator with XRE-family HTH domain